MLSWPCKTFLCYNMRYMYMEYNVLVLHCVGLKNNCVPLKYLSRGNVFLYWHIQSCTHMYVLYTHVCLVHVLVTCCWMLHADPCIIRLALQPEMHFRLQGVCKKVTDIFTLRNIE